MTPAIQGPVLPEVVMHLHPPADPALAVVVENVRCAGKKASGFTRHLAFDVTGTRLQGAFRVGQSFGVLPEGVDTHGRSHKLRLYSIACPSRGEDGEGRVLSTTVKRVIDEHWETQRLFLGVCSNYLCDLKPGHQVRLTGPSGKRFLLPIDPCAHDYLFIATGTGIAPFRGMVRELLEAGVTSRIVLLMGSPYASDLIYDELFRALSSRHANFHYFTSLSRERQDDGAPGMYVQDRLAACAAAGEVLEGGRGLLYICGVAGMELGVFQALARMLPGEALGRFLDADPVAFESVDTWTRRMIHKQVRPTRNVFLEVY